LGQAVEARLAATVEQTQATARKAAAQQAAQAAAAEEERRRKADAEYDEYRRQHQERGMQRTRGPRP
jgi:hypothetical protein